MNERAEAIAHLQLLIRKVAAAATTFELRSQMHELAEELGSEGPVQEAHSASAVLSDLEKLTDKITINQAELLLLISKLPRR